MGSMDVKYTDGAAAVLLDGVGRVERGQTVKVSPETGKQLIAQGWKSVEKTKRPDAGPKKESE